MTDYSESESAFTNVRLHQIRVLLGLLGDSSISDKEYFRRRYSENAMHFDDTLEFLTRLSCIEDRSDTLTADATFLGCIESTNELNKELLRRLVRLRSPLQAEVQSYLRQFRVTNDGLVHQPAEQQRGRESQLRNLLMELAVIWHDHVSDSYLLHPAYYDLFRRASAEHVAIPRQVIERRLGETAAIGLAAEISVVDYERQRVGSEFADNVEHVSLADATAGYDVASVTVGEGQTCPRLIEVKAVPSGSFRFYWTVNEIETARRFGPWYFLYLVPVSEAGKFDFDSIRVISDPRETIFDGGEWIAAPHVYECELAPKMPSGSGAY